MINKKTNRFLNVGITVVVISLMLSIIPSAVLASDSNNIATESNDVTSLVLGGPGYFIRVTNNKNTTITADVVVNLTSMFVEEEFIHQLTVSPGTSNIVYKIGGLFPYIFARVSAEVTVDEDIIANRTGFLILGLIIFTT